MAARSKTGMETVYLEAEVLPHVDMHMHSQSNNCCPLPLMWGVFASQLPLYRPESDRKFLNSFTASVVGNVLAGRFGRIGRLSTDLVGKLYMHKLKKTDMQQYLYWLSFSEKKLEKMNKDNSQETLIVAAEKIKLDEINAQSLTMWDEQFIKSTNYYFAGIKPLRCCLALSMDLSYSHYWGRTGLPLYLETDDALWYVNDFAAADLSGDHNADAVDVAYKDSVLDVETTLPENHLMNWRRSEGYGAINAVVHLHAHFFPNEFPHYGNTSFYEYQYHLRRNVRSPAGEKDYPMVRFETGTGMDEEQLSELVKKKFVHIVAVAKNEKNDSGPGGDCVKRFEDYAMQRENTIKTMFEFPLQFFAAYHFDPRRHLLNGSDTTSSLATEILKRHSFFTAEHDNKSPPVRLSTGVAYRNAVTLTPHPFFNDHTFLDELLSSQQRSVDDALSELLKCSDAGMFWAVKMYPRLGYSPDDYINYPNLVGLYKKCSESNIPVIVHCGPGGMSVHDYYLYERYDNNTVKKNYDLKYSEDLFDGIICGSASNDSPVQWRRVLEGYRDLKLCLAHFGGYDLWAEIGDFKKASKKVRSFKETLESGKYDRYDLYRDWVREIAELVTEFDNVYTDISCFLNEAITSEDTHHMAGDENGGCPLVADNLYFLITTHPDLVDRLCVGSDWYMYEPNHLAGTGEYMLRMFNTLKMVTAMLVKDKKKDGSTVEPFDVWHQFAVVNPLRYLGLIEEVKGSKGPFKVKTDWLEKYKERLGIGEDDKCDVHTSAGTTESTTETKKTYSLLSTNTIIDSRLILKDQDFLVLCD